MRGGRALANAVDGGTGYRVPFPFASREIGKRINEVTIGSTNVIWEVALRLKSGEPLFLGQFPLTSIGHTRVVPDPGVAAGEDALEEPALLPCLLLSSESKCLLGSSVKPW